MGKLFASKKCKAVIITVFAFLLLYISHSQQQDSIRAMYSRIQMLSDGDFKELKQLETEAQPYFQRNASFSLKEQALLHIIMGGIKIMTFGPDSAMAVLQRADSLSEKAFGNLSLENRQAKTYLSWAYGYRGNFEMERQISNVLLDAYLKDKKPDTNEIANLYHTIAVDYGMGNKGGGGDRIAEQEMLHKGIVLLSAYQPVVHSKEDSLFQINYMNLYGSLALSSYATYNFDDALFYTRQSLELRQKYNPNAAMAINFMLIGRSLYKTEHKVDTALFYLDSALNILENAGMKNSVPWLTYTGYKAEILTDAGQLNNAISITQSVIKELKQTGELNALTGGAFVLSTSALSKALIKMGKTKEAVAVCEQVKDFIKKQVFHGNLADLSLYSQYATALSSDGQWKKAEEEFTDIISRTGYSIDSLQNPASQLQVTMPYQSLQIYGQAGGLFVNKGFATGKPALVSSGIVMLHKTVDVLKRKKQWFFEAGIDEENGDMDTEILNAYIDALYKAKSLLTANDKLNIPLVVSDKKTGELIKDVQDTLLNTLYRGRNMLNEKDLFNMAFEAIDGSKADLLKSKLFEDRQLSTMISYDENKQRLNLKSSVYGAMAAMRKRISKGVEDSLVKAKIEYTTFVQSLKNKYKPDELKLTGAMTAKDTALIQYKGTLINYFLGENYLYAFVHSNGTQQFIRREIPKSFDEDLEFMRNTCLNKNASAGDENYARMLQIQKDWHRWLLGDIKLGSELTIIPHRELSFISFEMLDAGSSATQPVYVMENHAVRYEISASFLKSNPVENKVKDLAFFGGFAASNFNAALLDKLRDNGTLSSTRGDIGTLENSNEEVNNIAGRVSGKAYRNVRPGDFLKHAADYKVLHIATHAVADQGPYHESSLVFEADDKNNCTVRDVEIMPLNLHADMVVLSACQTGVGRLNNSEGVRSLGRAFFLTGCPAVVMSLWKVNDASTAKIMTSFYTHLQQGQTKSQALRSAKLDYLKDETNPAKKHPYYWAGFIVMGNDAPLNFDSGNKHSWLLFAFAAIILIALIAFVLRRKNTALQAG